MPKIYRYGLVSACFCPRYTFPFATDSETLPLTSDWQMRWDPAAMFYRHKYVILLYTHYTFFIVFKLPAKKKNTSQKA